MLTLQAPPRALPQPGNRTLRTTAGQPVLGPWLRAQAVNLARHTRALRNFRREEFGTGAEMPTAGHVLAVNQLMARLRPILIRRARRMHHLSTAAIKDAAARQLTAAVTHKHYSHDGVRHIEKIWDFYFELFGQRQTRFGPWLLACDRIALDCYQQAFMGLPIAKSIPAPPPRARGTSPPPTA